MTSKGQREVSGGLPPHQVTVWRTPLVYRLFFPPIGMYFLGNAVVFFDGGSDLAVKAMSAVVGLLFIVGPFRPCIRLQPENVYARSVFFSRRIPLREVEDVVPSYGGLNIITRDGRRFEATGVGEKWNLTRWLGRRGKADGVADVILAARDARCS